METPAAEVRATPGPGAALRRAGVWLAVVLGLAATGHAVFSPRVRAVYAHVADSEVITQWGQKATWADVPRWFTGAWIQEDSPYYRPLSSLLFWAEVRAFGKDFTGHAVVSWVIHGAICGLLYLLALRWVPGPPGQRVVWALVTVVLFNVRRGPQGPGWLAAPVSYGVVAWWPGQTDQTCLLVALLSLLSLDRWLVEGTRAHLWRGLGWWVVALGFKEMAVCVPLVVGCQILMRRGWGTLALWRRDEEGKATAAPGLAWRVVTPWLAVVAGFLLVRPLLVPGAWGPKARSLDYFARKIGWYLAEAPIAITEARGVWVVVLAVFVAGSLYAYARLGRRPSAVWLVLWLAVGLGVLAQLLAGNFAVVTIPRELGAIGVVALLLLGLVVLGHVREGATWALLGMVAAVHLPILQVKGPHYMYWPSAFWALFNAALLVHATRSLLGRGRGE